MERKPEQSSNKRCILSILIILMITAAGMNTHAEDDIIVLDGPDMIWYNPGLWLEQVDPTACGDNTPSPDSRLDASVFFFIGDLPGCGYPLHRALVAGVNDTFQVGIELYNPSREDDYKLTGLHCEDWFAPRIYHENASASSIPWRESSEIGYRIRGWFDGTHMLPPPDKVPPRSHRSMLMDIWNLPEGRFQLCFLPTKQVPKDVSAYRDGCVLAFYPAQSLADSTNGYIACFNRALMDSNFSAAKEWADAILQINPTSVPGWSLTATYCLLVQDTLEAKKSYDNAIEYLEKRQDPALPDSTKRALAEIENTYLSWTLYILKDNRARLGP